MEKTEFIEKLNSSDHFVHHNNIRITDVAPGYAEAVLEVGPDTFNSLGIVQGGAIFTLSDFAFAAASNFAGDHLVAHTANIVYVRPGTAPQLRAVAREVSRGRRTGVYSIDVFDSNQKLVAHSTITGFVFPAEKQQ